MSKELKINIQSYIGDCDLCGYYESGDWVVELDGQLLCEGSFDEHLGNGTGPSPNSNPEFMYNSILQALGYSVTLEEERKES